MRTLLSLLLLGTFGLAQEAQAGGFTPWGVATGDKRMALTPYFFVGPDGTSTLSPYIWFGATDHFDVMFGYTISFDPSPEPGAGVVAPGSIEVMPRGIINDYAIFALHALYAPGNDSATLGVEFHGVAAADFFAFTYNTGWWPTVGGAGGFDTGTWFALLVPEFLLTDRFSIFAEFNPNVTLSDGSFGANVVPGLTFYVDKDLKHSLTAAVTMAVAPEFAGATFGLLYWTDFDLSARKKLTKSRGMQGSRSLTAQASAGAPTP